MAVTEIQLEYVGFMASLAKKVPDLGSQQWCGVVMFVGLWLTSQVKNPSSQIHLTWVEWQNLSSYLFASSSQTKLNIFP